MMLIGVIWAIFAPLLLLIPIGAMYLVANRIPALSTKKHKIIFAIAFPVAIVFSLWLSASFKFETHCQAIGKPQIFEKRKVDGIFLNDSTANSFGMRYLHDEGFLWMEARSIYNREGFTRYEISPTGLTQHEVDKLSATIEVENVFSEDAISSTTRTTIRDRLSNKILAEAGDAYFHGGAARIFLGAWGSKSCSSIMTSSGSAEFNQFYHLAKLTLR